MLHADSMEPLPALPLHRVKLREGAQRLRGVLFSGLKVERKQFSAWAQARPGARRAPICCSVTRASLCPRSPAGVAWLTLEGEQNLSFSSQVVGFQPLKTRRVFEMGCRAEAHAQSWKDTTVRRVLLFDYPGVARKTGTKNGTLGKWKHGPKPA